MIFAQVDARVLSIRLQHISILLINITHGVCIIRFRPVGVVAQAHIAVGHYCQAGRHGSQGSHSRRLLLLSQSAW